MYHARWIITGAAVLTAACSAGILIASRPLPAGQTLPEITQPQGAPSETALQVQADAVRTAETAPAPASSYLLKLNETTLSVYREGERSPEETYEIPSGWLPDYDRILLEYGIRAESEAELRSLLEDYLS